MENEFDYYLIGGDGNPNSPLLRADEGQSTFFLEGEKPVEIDEPIRLCFNNPIPQKPKLLDFHKLSDAVVSKKIYDVLASMNIYGIQLVPAVIRNNKTNDLHDNYWIIYVYNEIMCMDREKSVYTVDEDDEDDEIDDIREFLLDLNILSEIPLEKRLIFLLGEDRSKGIYHKSVVDAIMAVNPKGIHFHPIEKWYEGQQFD
jgi:hypothetical protein